MDGPTLIVSGPWRKPHNDLVHQSYGGHASLHDADQAERLLGTRDAPIHGTTHLSQFTPLLLQVFGHEWFERGTISVFFKKMVSHQKPVQAQMELPHIGTAAADQQLRLWLRFEDGSLALEGTASLGHVPGSTVSQQLSKVTAPRDELIIMKGIKIGDRSPRVKVSVRDWDMNLRELGHGTFPYTMREKLKVITEPHLWFTEEGGAKSPWGSAILPPENIHSVMYPQGLPRWPRPQAVGLLGACEMRLFNGPVVFGGEYELETEVIKVGETPRTEFYWTKSTLYSGDKVVGEMDLQQMSLKNSYPGPEARGYAKAGGKAKL
eukprot:gnl/TRDRNA2_/TRDRNA2_201523_c0_seq1.p1 gnl/TRDRNA2_/TRDRNA2_201523_c0~~gnl/TRDRNA2_/TRDRNA2_201523_c0_seq1.p1  ORF type:complete len:321 (+),score=59.47 gnl/TRDRNA2_/TRDRNA2_201523_c0_seq1:44-1006(+)